MAEAVALRSPEVETLSSIKKTYSRLDTVELIAKVVATLEEVGQLQKRSRNEALEQKEDWITKNISAVRWKGTGAATITAAAFGATLVAGQTWGPLIQNLSPVAQQAVDGGFLEPSRVEAELRGAMADQEVQAATTDQQKTSETISSLEQAEKGVATFYNR